LAGEDGEAFQAVDLGALDLCIPVGALRQPDHQTPARAPRKVDEKVDDEGAALAVSLDDETEAVPAGKIGVEAERLDEVERQIESIGLLGVDVEADVIGFGERREMFYARQKLAHHASALDPLVARMQGRELDRDAGPLVDAALVRGAADGVHGA